MRMPKPVTNVVRPHVESTTVTPTPPSGTPLPVHSQHIEYPDTVKGRAAAAEQRRQEERDR